MKRLPGMRDTWVRSLGQEDTLEKRMVTQSSILAWRIPWTEEPGGLYSIGSQRVRHDWEAFTFKGFPDSSVGKESTCNAGDRSLIPGSGRSAGEGIGYPLLYSWASLVAGKESACNVVDLGSIPGLGRSPGKGKGYPLQYSGLENSMDCIVHGVAKSWT